MKILKSNIENQEMADPNILVFPKCDGSSQLDGDDNPDIGNVDSNTSSTLTNQLAKFADTTGKLITNSLVTIDSSNNIANVNNLSLSTLTTPVINSSTTISLQNSGTTKAQLSGTTLLLKGISLTTDPGEDLNLFPPSGNINCNSKNITNVNTLSGNGSLTVQNGSVDGTLTLTNRGTAFNLLLQNNFSTIATVASTGLNIASGKSLSSASGNLSISSAGTDITFNSKNLTSIGTLTTTGLATVPSLTVNSSTNSAGNVIQIGPNNNASVANPSCINFNGEYGGPKLKLLNSNTTYLVGVNANQLFITGGSTASDYVSVYTAGTERIRIGTNMQINVPVTNASGDLSLNPAGSNINMNNKNLTNVGSVTIPTNTSTAVINFSAAATNTGTDSGPYIYLGNSFSNLGNQASTMKIRISSASGWSWGSAAINQIVPLDYYHRWYCTDDDSESMRMEISKAAITIGDSMTVTTSSGDLNLAAFSSTINFNSCNLTNFNLSHATASGSDSSTNFTGNLTFNWYKLGNQITVSISGTSTCSGAIASWQSTTAIIPAGYRPPSSRIVYQLALLDNATEIRVQINSTGVVSIFKHAGGGWSTSDVIQFATTNPWITYMNV